jgi:cytochrome b561
MTTVPTTPTERSRHARHGYSSTQIAFHWSVVLLVVANWLLGFGMEQVYERRNAGEVFAQWGPAFMHIAIGIAIFGTMLARLLARINRPVETAAGSKHHIMKVLAWVNHWAFYAVLLAMPPLGLLAWFFRAEWAGALHSFLAWTLPFLIAAHVGGALLHLILGENVIRRILRPTAGT